LSKDICSNNLFGIGVCAAFGGAAALMVAPWASVLPAYGLIASGAACMADSIAHMSKYDVVFKTLKLGKGDAYPLFKGRSKKEGYTLYEFTLPAGMTVDDFTNKQNAIEEYIGRPVEFAYGYKNLLVREYPHNERTLYDYEPQKLKGSVPLMLGYDRTGKLVSVDLASGEPHMYVAGETGSGKSTSLRAIIVNLILCNDIDLYLIDLKNGVEFNMFRNCGCVQGFARNEGEAYTMLTQILKEVERRYNLFAEADCENIISYNKHNAALRYQILIIDEYATLMYEKDSTAVLEQLAAKSRACGIHLLLSTQRPDAKVISGRIKANISNVLGLKTLDRTNSTIIIGHDGLERLRGAGHAIFKRGADETTLQSPYLPVERAKELIAPFIAAKLKEPHNGPQDAVDSFDFLDAL